MLTFVFCEEITAIFSLRRHVGMWEGVPVTELEGDLNLTLDLSRRVHPTLGGSLRLEHQKQVDAPSNGPPACVALNYNCCSPVSSLGSWLFADLEFCTAGEQNLHPVKHTWKERDTQLMYCGMEVARLGVNQAVGRER